MMAKISQHGEPTGMRIANSHVAAVAGNVDHNCYPSSGSSTIGAIHDVGYYRNIFASTENYSLSSQLDVLEVMNDRIGERSIATETDCQSYLNVGISDS
jgi:hypothetical protein